MVAESNNPKVSDYKYNGKELDQMHGLNHYDYSARQYDPARLQFTTVDPLAEKYYSWNPYNYVYNNPIRFIDPDGKGPGDVVVAFGGADIKRNGDKGLASSIISLVVSQELSVNGGNAQAFTSDYWGSNIYSKDALDKVTQGAYDFVRNNI